MPRSLPPEYRRRYRLGRRLTPPPPPPTGHEALVIAERAQESREELAAFDQFPPEIREIIATSAYMSNARKLARTILPLLERFPAALVAAEMLKVRSASEAATLDRIALDYFYATGTTLPHVAARATIMR